MPMRLISLGVLAILASAAPAVAQGNLVVYCSVLVDWCQLAATEFERATGVKVTLSAKGSGETFAQIRAEASNPRGDVWWGGTGDPHLQAAEALGADVSRAADADAGAILADRIRWFMRELHVPNGLAAVGYTASDIPALVEGTLPQHRVTKLSPRPAGEDDLARLFEQSMVAW